MTNARRAICVFTFLLVLAFLTAFCLVMNRGSYNIWASFVVLPLLFVTVVPIALREARRQSDDRLVELLLGAFALKMLAALVRYIVSFDVYSSSDATTYHLAGIGISRSFRQGVFQVDLPGKLTGTNFMKLLTGIIYTITGPTKLGGFFVFSWLGYLGLFFLYKAFQVAMPNGDHRRYLLLVFFLPSLLFWPSSIGKDSWMLFGIGLTALGAGRVYARRFGGYLLIVAGLLALDAARPHVALMILVPMFAGFLIRRSQRKDALVAAGTNVAGLVVFLLVGSVVVANAQAFLGVDKFNTDTVNQVLKGAEGRTGQGGSEFSAPNPQSPIGFPVAVVTVLFRPFPFEAHNVGAAIASFEGVFLVVLCIRSRRRLKALPKMLLRQPYLLFCLIYTLLFIFAFSSFNNFGILARERVQVFPFVLALLSVRDPRRQGRAAAEASRPRSSAAVSVPSRPGPRHAAPSMTE